MRNTLRRLLPIALAGACVAAPVLGQQPSGDRHVELSGSASVTSLPASAKRYALVIGVDEYDDPQITPLKGAANDATALAAALIASAGFPHDQVFVLSTAAGGERPTRGNILRRLSNLRGVIPSGGLLLVAFSGHGIERNGKGYLLPSDAQALNDVSLVEDTAISVDRLRELIKATGVKQVVMLIDACRNDPTAGRGDADNPMTTTFSRGFDFDVKNREVEAFATIYAAAVGQRAFEDSNHDQGYFTEAIVRGLGGAAANGKGEVTLAGLVAYVQEAVPRQLALDLGAGKQQRPFATIEGYRADGLVLAVVQPAATVAPTPAPARPELDPKVAASQGNTTVDLGDGVRIEFVYVPAASFLMGNEDGYGNEGPAHRVTLSEPYLIGRYEVTQAQWVAVMGANPSLHKGADLPVESVSWDDVKVFISRLNIKAGGRFRLPTEAEWENACRAGTAADAPIDLKQVAWYEENSHGMTHGVGLKEPNAWGLYDMLGNVQEWCEDWDSSYEAGAVTNPRGPSTGTERVRRGGAWDESALNTTPTSRSEDKPGYRSDDLGFRLAKTVE